jgi:hypothetical protein
MKLSIWERVSCTIFLTIIAWALLGCAGTPTGASGFFASESSDIKPTIGKLTDEYRTVNDDYFYGGLPIQLTKIEFADLSVVEDMAMIHHDGDGIWHIEIDPKLHATEKQGEMSLLHEMCHQDDKIKGIDEGLDSHNENFQACMQRLAVKGAFRDLW